jgi:formiminotetrahydrofolate cyclodeaminase
MDIDEYISKLKSSSATPGGGSASAISSMFAASLNSMAALLSIGKKKLTNYEKDFARISGESEKIINGLRNLSTDDEKAFMGIMDALHMDKSDDRRTDSLNRAIKKSVEISWRIAEISLQNMENSIFLGIHGNKNLITDDITAAYMGYAAVHTSLNNIRINLKFEKEEEYKEDQYIKLKFFTENAEGTMNRARELEKSIIA